jgi:hypothetical protein
VNVAWTDFYLLAFIFHFANQFSVVVRLVYSFCEAVALKLLVASIAALLAKDAVVDAGVVGRSAVYSRYYNGPRTLP